MRDQFELELSTLRQETHEMSVLCENIITKAASLVVDEADEDDCRAKIHSMDGEIDRMERKIEGLCMRLLLLQQPVAKDLRNVSASLRMASDMERIGDQASDIAELAKYVRGCEAAQKTHLSQMADIVIQMVRSATKSFSDLNLCLAKKVIQRDDEVDRLFDQIKLELIQLIRDNGSLGEQYLDLLMIAKYLERVGDHAVNIAEWVEYAITGSHISGQ